MIIKIQIENKKICRKTVKFNVFDISYRKNLFIIYVFIAIIKI